MSTQDHNQEQESEKEAPQPENGRGSLFERIKAAAQAEHQTVAGDAHPAAKNEEAAFDKGSPDLEKAVQLALLNETNARIDAYRADTWLKEWLAPKVFEFMQAWCLFVGIIFLTYFFLKDGDIPSEVMIALLTTTTVSIVGLVGFLVQGLFKSAENKQQGNGPS